MKPEQEPIFRVRRVSLSDERVHWVYFYNWPDSDYPGVRNAVFEVIDWLRASFGPPQRGKEFPTRWWYWLDEMSDFSGTITLVFARHEDAALFTLHHRVKDTR